MTATRILFAIFFSLFTLASLQAQQTPSFSITYVADEQKDLESLEQISNILKSALTNRGYVWSDEPHYIFLLDSDFLPSEKANIAVVSIAVLETLPEEIIKLGGQGQVFYAAIQKNGIQRLGQGGVEIREQISMDYLRQFGMIVDTEILITQDVQSTLRSYAASFQPIW